MVPGLMPEFEHPEPSRRQTAEPEQEKELQPAMSHVPSMHLHKGETRRGGGALSMGCCWLDRQCAMHSAAACSLFADPDIGAVVVAAALLTHGWVAGAALACVCRGVGRGCSRG